MKEFPLEAKKAFIVWVICLLVFIFLMALSVFLKGTSFEALINSSISPILIWGVILGGGAFFLMFLISSISYFFKKGDLSRRNVWVKIPRTLLIILMLPILLFVEVLKPFQLIRMIVGKKKKDIFSKQSFKNYVLSFLIVLFLLPLWIVPFFIAGYFSANALGFVSSPVPISGTGSMYPTFPKSDKKTDLERAGDIVGSPDFIPYPNGLNLFGNRYFNHSLARGDIIVFQNSATEEITKKQYGQTSGFVKRLIALPGDTIELRNGLVYLDGKPLKEPYTAKPHSTFGESFLSECKKIVVPANKVFAMGDNRKGSGDSREIGFVDLKDIGEVLPINSQKGIWDKNYREVNNDVDESSKIKLNKDKYLELLNEKRKEAGVSPLKYQPKLEQSAFKRGEVILKFDDFSWEATRSGYTMQKAIDSVGYSNITYGEAPTQGYFEAEELMDNQLQFPDTKKFLLNKDNQEIGIAEVEGKINGCPTQVVIQHFAGYIPPNYKKEDIDSWGRVINNMDEIIPSWEGLKDWPKVNKDDLNKLIGLLYKRKRNAEAIYYRMKGNQWLTSEQDAMISEDKGLYEQIDILAKRLNGK